MNKANRCRFRIARLKFSVIFRAGASCRWAESRTKIRVIDRGKKKKNVLKNAVIDVCRCFRAKNCSDSILILTPRKAFCCKAIDISQLDLTAAIQKET